MIDQQTGNLILAPTVRVQAGDSLETVAALALGESNEMHDVQTGWKWLFARNVYVEMRYYILRFGFFNNSLKTVIMGVSQERFDLLATWDNWSEQAEMSRLVELKQWIQEEVGSEGRFPWGKVTADYDLKSASSGITINYN
ncbi:hypothetical protein [Hymenobacter sp. HDW8]|uniref:hypothetical protein n=1 Tax=Hymenobacter sp. HDW8 TaxID=2714932 RepID=UPI001409AEBD|nr:hypothetical protein [Hymenobacter sp. HDW8]QIL74973.1 hypothetical protein G7064_03205 [Hymenobacter sp. HDW8]